jgi:hypothetical protein
MRKRLLLWAGSLVVLAGIGFFSLRLLPTHKKSEESYKKLELRMSPSEIEAILNARPGDYRRIPDRGTSTTVAGPGIPVGRSIPAFLDNALDPNYRRAEWISDGLVITAIFRNDNGKEYAVRTSMRSLPASERTLFDRLCDLIGL